MLLNFDLTMPSYAHSRNPHPLLYVQNIYKSHIVLHATQTFLLQEKKWLVFLSTFENVFMHRCFPGFKEYIHSHGLVYAVILMRGYFISLHDLEPGGYGGWGFPGLALYTYRYRDVLQTSLIVRTCEMRKSSDSEFRLTNWFRSYRIVTGSLV
jgi:hypothetical protein